MLKGVAVGPEKTAPLSIQAVTTLSDASRRTAEAHAFTTAAPSAVGKFRRQRRQY